MRSSASGVLLTPYLTVCEPETVNKFAAARDPWMYTSVLGGHGWRPCGRVAAGRLQSGASTSISRCSDHRPGYAISQIGVFCRGIDTGRRSVGVGTESTLSALDQDCMPLLWCISQYSGLSPEHIGRAITHPLSPSQLAHRASASPLDLSPCHYPYHSARRLFVLLLDHHPWQSCLSRELGDTAQPLPPRTRSRFLPAHSEHLAFWSLPHPRYSQAHQYRRLS